MSLCEVNTSSTLSANSVLMSLFLHTADINSEEIITEEMLWERIPEVQGLDRANTYYELSARIYGI